METLPLQTLLRDPSSAHQFFKNKNLEKLQRLTNEPEEPLLIATHPIMLPSNLCDNGIEKKIAPWAKLLALKCLKYLPKIAYDLQNPLSTEPALTHLLEARVLKMEMCQKELKKLEEQLKLPTMEWKTMSFLSRCVWRDLELLYGTDYLFPSSERSNDLRMALYFLSSSPAAANYEMIWAHLLPPNTLFKIAPMREYGKNWLSQRSLHRDEAGCFETMDRPFTKMDDKSLGEWTLALHKLLAALWYLEQHPSGSFSQGAKVANDFLTTAMQESREVKEVLWRWLVRPERESFAAVLYASPMLYKIDLALPAQLPEVLPNAENYNEITDGMKRACNEIKFMRKQTPFYLVSAYYLKLKVESTQIAALLAQQHQAKAQFLAALLRLNYSRLEHFSLNQLFFLAKELTLNDCTSATALFDLWIKNIGEWTAKTSLLSKWEAQQAASRASSALSFYFNHDRLSTRGLFCCTRAESIEKEELLRALADWISWNNLCQRVTERTEVLPAAQAEGKLLFRWKTIDTMKEVMHCQSLLETYYFLPEFVRTLSSVSGGKHTGAAQLIKHYDKQDKKKARERSIRLFSPRITYYRWIDRMISNWLWLSSGQSEVVVPLPTEVTHILQPKPFFANDTSVDSDSDQEKAPIGHHELQPSAAPQFSSLVKKANELSLLGYRSSLHPRVSRWLYDFLKVKQAVGSFKEGYGHKSIDALEKEWVYHAIAPAIPIIKIPALAAAYSTKNEESQTCTYSFKAELYQNDILVNKGLIRIAYSLEQRLFYHAYFHDRIQESLSAVGAEEQEEPASESWTVQCDRSDELPKTLFCYQKTISFFVGTKYYYRLLPYRD